MIGAFTHPASKLFRKAEPLWPQLIELAKGDGLVPFSLRIHYVHPSGAVCVHVSTYKKAFVSGWWYGDQLVMEGMENIAVSDDTAADLQPVWLGKWHAMDVYRSLVNEPSYSDNNRKISVFRGWKLAEESFEFFVSVLLGVRSGYSVSPELYDVARRVEMSPKAIERIKRSEHYTHWAGTGEWVVEESTQFEKKMGQLKDAALVLNKIEDESEALLRKLMEGGK